jgi:hypothetical protein
MNNNIHNNPNTDRYDGDMLIIIGPNGADYEVVGGDPVRDQGFINHINIAMLTRPGWCGNELEPVETRKISSKYLPVTDQPITRQSLLDTNKAAEADVKGTEFGDVKAITTVPSNNTIQTAIFVQSPAGNIEALLLSKHGKNWVNQIINTIQERARP